MFLAPKYARLSVATANAGYEVAQLNAAVTQGKLRLKDGYYLRPIQVPVLGCGDEIPDGWDAENRGSFKIVNDPDAFASDLETLQESMSWQVVAEITNGGLDLHARGEAGFADFKKSTGKIGPDKKATWILNNKAEFVRGLVAAGKDFGTNVLVAEYDRIHAGK